MDQDIFGAVRTGDLQRVRYLVEVQAVELQQHDDWSATPLYYAALCGHREIAEYLLSRGAKCEEKTYDGERCLYAALNDDIRRVLLDEGFKRAGARGHDLYLEFVEKLFNRPSSFPDVFLDMGEGDAVGCHRFLLAARCPNSDSLLQRPPTPPASSRHAASSWPGTNASPGAAFSLLRWAYTCRLEVRRSDAGECGRLARDLGLAELAEALEGALEEGGEEQQAIVVEPSREEAKRQLQDALDATWQSLEPPPAPLPDCPPDHCSDPSPQKIEPASGSKGSSDGPLTAQGRDSSAAAGASSSGSFISSSMEAAASEPETGSRSGGSAAAGAAAGDAEVGNCSRGGAGGAREFCDVWLRAPGGAFGCHRAVLASRSEYFAAMLHSQFREGRATERDGAMEVALPGEDAAVLRVALRWCYCDRVEADLPAELLLEVLRYADRALMEGLKARCGVLLHPAVESATALPLLAEALRLGVDRLADACMRCIAEHLFDLVGDPQLLALVRESAATVVNREDVDSVPIVDDIRYHIAQIHGDGELSDEDDEAYMFLGEEEHAAQWIAANPATFEQLSERRRKLVLLEQLLENLGLEA